MAVVVASIVNSVVVGISSVLSSVLTYVETHAGLVTVGATLMIAIATTYYAITSRRQLGVMRSQLDELKSYYVLQRQPLLTLDHAWLQARTTHPFPTGRSEYAVSQSLAYHVEYGLLNRSSEPAVSVLLSFHLCATETTGPTELVTQPLSLECLEAGARHPPLPATARATFRASAVPEGDPLVQLLAPRPDATFALRVSIYYKNVLGGCFVVTGAHQVAPTREERERLAELSDRLADFFSGFASQIEALQQAMGDGSPKAKQLLADLQREYVRAFPGGGPVQLATAPVPGGARVEVVGNEEFEARVRELLSPPRSARPAARRTDLRLLPAANGGNAST